MVVEVARDVAVSSFGEGDETGGVCKRRPAAQVPEIADWTVKERFKSAARISERRAVVKSHTITCVVYHQASKDPRLLAVRE